MSCGRTFTMSTPAINVNLESPYSPQDYPFDGSPHSKCQWKIINKNKNKWSILLQTQATPSNIDENILLSVVPDNDKVRNPVKLRHNIGKANVNIAVN